MAWAIVELHDRTAYRPCTSRRIFNSFSNYSLTICSRVTCARSVIFFPSKGIENSLRAAAQSCRLLSFSIDWNDVSYSAISFCPGLVPKVVNKCHENGRLLEELGKRVLRQVNEIYGEWCVWYKENYIIMRRKY